MSKLHETLAAQATRIVELKIENECLQKARDAMEWIRTDTAHKAPEQITVELLTTYITELEGALEREKKGPEESAPTLKPRYHDGSWWAYDAEHDSDTGPYSSREQAQEWIDEIKP